MSSTLNDPARRDKIAKTSTARAQTDVAAFLEIAGRDKVSRRIFCERLLHIEDKLQGTFGPWRMNFPQRRIEALRQRTIRAKRPERYAILKSRKWGVSTQFLAYGVEYVTRNAHASGCIIADEAGSAAQLLTQAKKMRDSLPARLPIRFDNRNQLSFGEPLHSYLEIETARTEDPIRGRMFRFVHCTEPQVWKDAGKKRAAIENAVPDHPGTLVAYEGTGFGRNWWYDFWFDAQAGKNEFQAIFLAWWHDPSFDFSIQVAHEEERAIIAGANDYEKELLRLGVTAGQLAWRRKKISTSFQGDVRLFGQEFPSTPDEAFLAEGNPVFVPEFVLRKGTAVREPVWQGDILESGLRQSGAGVKSVLSPNPRGALKIWRRPEANHAYAMGSDSGHGIGQDPSACFVVDVESAEMVASWHGQAEPRPFGRQLAALGELYHWAYLLPEIEGPGIATLDMLKECTYPTIGHRSAWDEAGKVMSRKMGWSTNIRSRPMLFNEIREHLADPEGPGIPDRGLIDEMLCMYRDEQEKECCPKGKHDDRVMSWGVTLHARKDVLESGVVEESRARRAQTIEERHWQSFHEQTDEPREDDDSFDTDF